MSDLKLSDFKSFFEELWGKDHSPFPWQERLVKRVASDSQGENPWPAVLALPTASGKTACIDIAIFALACQGQSLKRTAPRRIFFVIDRRIVVDEAFERARVIADKLVSAKSGILAKVAERLRDLAGGEDEPLACFQLRGGIYKDDAWARSPLQPTVIVSTVDQIGSRLLFRGYGLRSGSMWPVHAGLAANDSLILLDEAHCANPFRQTIQAIQKYRSWHDTEQENIPESPFHIIQISATPTSQAKDVFSLDKDDLNHHILKPRITASKTARLEVAKTARGQDALDNLAKELVYHGKRLVNKERKAIAIIVNRVATAKKVYQILSADSEYDTVLMTGRMRPLDREDVVSSWLEKLKAGKRTEQLERPVFIVATQTLEVGANLDFDAMVSECASLDALRQRFGRLNRMGRPIDSAGIIVIRADQINEAKEESDADPIYGNALPRTWSWLLKHASDNKIDVGIKALDALLKDDKESLAELTPPSPNAPMMVPAYIDCWAQTSPQPTPDPDVSLFLHGPQRGAPEVQVCWRADLNRDDRPLGEIESEWIDLVSHCPPSSIECMPAPLHIVRRWMQGNDENDDLTDVEGGLPSRANSDDDKKHGRYALRWLGPEDSELIVDNPRKLQPGDTLILSAEQRGWNIFGHLPNDSKGRINVDVGDRAHLAARALPVLRLSLTLIEQWPACAELDELRSLLSDEGLESIDVVLELVRSISNKSDTMNWLKTILDAFDLQIPKKRRLEFIHYPNKAWLSVRGKRRVPQIIKGYRDTSNFNFTDEDQSSSATVEVDLDKHLQGVERYARHFADGAQLPERLVSDIALAGKLHDLGKSDPRFQALLHGGNPWIAQASGRLLAKSSGLPLGRSERIRAYRQSGYPIGGRHELLSVKMVEKEEKLLKQAYDQDLVLHLIASHHGRCRPFAPVIEDENSLNTTLDIFGFTLAANTRTESHRLDSGISERFWRLVRRYGWWRLAWLEAIMRLADHRCSESEQRESESSTKTKNSLEVA